MGWPPRRRRVRVDVLSPLNRQLIHVAICKDVLFNRVRLNRRLWVSDSGPDNGDRPYAETRAKVAEGHQPRAVQL